ncbi:MAG: L,D-transpeptidase family protein [Candidatus Omnitrophota bacterium]
MKRLLMIVSLIVVILALVFMVMFAAGQSKGKKAFNKGYLKEAEQAFSGGDYLKARALYKQTEEATNDTEQLKEIQKRIEDINIKIIFSPVMDKCSVTYTVKPGDSLEKIAKEHKTTIGLIKRANNLTSDIIRPAQELKIETCKFSIVVDKSQNLLFLKTGDEIIKTYVVSTGKNNSTPVGVFKIINKEINPTWFKTGAVIPSGSPENILGTRWMGIEKKGYGIHGTTEPEQLGKQVTLGCVRMKNEEVEELYDIVPTGTEVTIID